MHVITMAIMAGVMLFGAFLIWKGMKRTSRLVTMGPTGSEMFVTRPETDNASPPEMPDFGAFITRCGPRQDGLTNYVVFGIGMLLFAILCFMAPSTFLVPKPGDESMIRTVSWITGGLSVLFGLGMLWKPLFGQNQVIFLYERGLVERVGAVSYRIAIDAIEQLRVQEWYDHRFAPRTFNVRAKVKDQRELSFSSALRGESERIIAYLAERVRQTEMVPFQP